MKEERFLAFVVRAWPKGAGDVALDANAYWVGAKVGMTNEETKGIVESLVMKGLLHKREVEGVILVHPTKSGIDRVRITPAGRVAHALKSFLGLLRRGR